MRLELTVRDLEALELAVPTAAGWHEQAAQRAIDQIAAHAVSLLGAAR